MADQIFCAGEALGSDNMQVVALSKGEPAPLAEERLSSGDCGHEMQLQPSLQQLALQVADTAAAARSASLPTSGCAMVSNGQDVPVGEGHEHVSTQPPHAWQPVYQEEHMQSQPTWETVGQRVDLLSSVRSNAAGSDTDAALQVGMPAHCSPPTARAAPLSPQQAKLQALARLMATGQLTSEVSPVVASVLKRAAANGQLPPGMLPPGTGSLECLPSGVFSQTLPTATQNVSSDLRCSQQPLGTYIGPPASLGKGQVAKTCDADQQESMSLGLEKKIDAPPSIPSLLAAGKDLDLPEHLGHLHCTGEFMKTAFNKAKMLNLCRQNCCKDMNCVHRMERCEGA
eukprot:365942-Chlamydomonas_euryale.AAC.27